MALTRSEVKHLGKLARIDLSETEISEFSEQLSEVLDFMKILNEIDTTHIPETHQVTGLKDVMREDKISKRIGSVDLLNCSVLKKRNNQIQVKKVI